MPRELHHTALMSALDWAYDKALNGVAGLDSAEELAADYLRGEGDLESKVNSLIRWQDTKAATSGFLAGLGGVLSMPVTVPANVASVMYVQIRMIAAIAHMGGHDLRDDRVKSLVYVCLVGDAAKDVLKDIGIALGTKMATSLIKGLSKKTLAAVNQRVGFTLVSKFGEKGVINLGKAVPLLGGLIGGAMDAATTHIIGNVARRTFIDSLPGLDQP